MMSNREYTSNDTIFVMMGCYRDPELQWTIKDLYEKANKPENIFLGIHLLYDKETNEDNDLFEIPFVRKEQIRIEEIDYRDSVSICYSKNREAKLYNEEKYVLQTDCHMRFKKNWDKILVEDIKTIESKKPFLCGSMPGYTLDPIRTDFDSDFNRCRIFFNEGTGLFRNSNSNSIPLKKNFENTSCYLGAFLFFEGKFLKNIIHNDMLGNNDEFPTCVKIFTNGLNMFFYKNNVLNHLYQNNINKKMEKARILYQNSLNSDDIFRHQFGIRKTNNKEILKNIQKYPIGNKRTLRDYERFSGVDFRKKTTREHTKQGIFEEWQEVVKISDIKNVFNNKYCNLEYAK